MLQTSQTKPQQPKPDRDTARIRDLNDGFRRRPELGLGVTGRVLVTAGIARMSWGDKAAILREVRCFEAFNDDNDPWGEHDFGALDYKGQRLFWKIDYYDRDGAGGSPSPADPAVTYRVLTVMLADEY